MMRYSILSKAFLLAFICLVPSYGQTKNEKTFAGIPIAQRARFIERLNLYIEYSIKGQRGKLVELYDEDTVCSLCKCKKECVENCKPPMVAEVPEDYHAALVEFKPKKVRPYKHDAIWNYYIDVEQKERVSWKGKAPRIVKSKVRMFAVYQNGDWYFSLVSIDPLVEL